MKRHMSGLPLNALRAFEAAARLGSFKAAASELAVTPAAVSHQVKALEAHLGLVLFERLNRALRLTSGGTRLAAASEDAFHRLEKILADLDAGGLSAGPAMLTISAAPSFAAKWLVPRLHHFQAAHPKIDLRLQAGDALADLAAGATVDLALRYGAGDYGDALHAEKLWPTGEMLAVCAPALLAGGSVKKPADVLRYSLLRTAAPAARRRPTRETAPADGWSAWLKEAGIPAAKQGAAMRGPIFGTSQLALEAVFAGRGFALVPRVLAADDLAGGRLVEPFNIRVTDPFSYWLVYADRRAGEARIRAFARWIRAEAATAPGR